MSSFPDGDGGSCHFSPDIYYINLNLFVLMEADYNNLRMMKITHSHLGVIVNNYCWRAVTAVRIDLSSLQTIIRLTTISETQ
jgi:hypothetical protein